MIASYVPNPRKLLSSLLCPTAFVSIIPFNVKSLQKRWTCNSFVSAPHYDSSYHCKYRDDIYSEINNICSTQEGEETSGVMRLRETICALLCVWMMMMSNANGARIGPGKVEGE